MYMFEAHYTNMDTSKKRIQSIKLNEYQTEKECYIHAITKAYDNKKANECLESLEFIAC